MEAVADCLVACALKQESAALKQHLGPICQHLVTGLGAKRTRRSLESYFSRNSPRLFVFTGTAGQLDPKLKMGDVVLPEAWGLRDGRRYPADSGLIERLRDHGWEVSDLGLTVKTPVIRKQAREDLHRLEGASICDLECAIALEVAESHGIAGLAPKVISDTAESGFLAFWSEFDKNMLRLADYLKMLIQLLDPPP